MTVNGKVYDWADVDFKIPGLDIEVQEISYDDELDQEAVYGRGNKPRGFGTGNYSSTGKISLLRDDYHKLLRDKLFEKYGGIFHGRHQENGRGGRRAPE